MAPAEGPRITIAYCTQCNWLLRSAWMAQELLSTFGADLGGLLEARKVAVLAEGFGAQVAPHLYAGPIACAAAIQLGLTIPNFLILETIGAGAGFHAELLARPIAWEEGYVLPPEGPGLGVEVDEAVARAHLWRGGRLHLEMDEAPPDPGAAPFGGG